MRPVCQTAGCTNPATRTVRWTWPAANEGRYCDDCAFELWVRGDETDPPFPGADIIELYLPGTFFPKD